MNNLEKDIKSGNIKPIYLVYGKEHEFINETVSFLSDNILSKAERSFNQLTLYGKETDSSSIIENVRRLPMMAKKTVVIVKEAQLCKDLHNLAHYTAKPSKKSVLILAAKTNKIDKRKKWVSGIKKNGEIIECKTLYENQIGPWIQRYVLSSGRKISPESVDVLKEYLGSNISKIKDALSKIYINVDANSTINVEDAKEIVTNNNDYDIFTLQKALSFGSNELVIQIIMHIGANSRQNPPPWITAMMYNYFSRIWKMHYIGNRSDSAILSEMSLSSTFFLKEYRQAQKRFSKKSLIHIFELLHDYDLKSKGLYSGNAEPLHLLLEMFVSILNLRTTTVPK